MFRYSSVVHEVGSWRMKELCYVIRRSFPLCLAPLLMVLFTSGRTKGYLMTAILSPNQSPSCMGGRKLQVLAVTFITSETEIRSSGNCS
jgi:hypothetical protein